MQIQLTPENAEFVAVASADSYRTPDQVTNDIIDTYRTAVAMVPIIPPPDPRDAIDDWDPTAAD